MSDLIEALTILSKYMSGSERNPTNCTHDCLAVMYDGEVSDDDARRLDELGFIKDTEGGDCCGCWFSFRFGSA